MKAVQFDQYGGVEVLQIVDKPTPEPRVDEVVVQVKAAGLNPGEIGVREGYLHETWPAIFPSGEGTDFSGVVTTVGSLIMNFKPGDEVYGFVHNRSSHAEYVAVNESNLAIKPKNIPWEVVGSLNVAGTTAVAGINAVNVQSGDIVAVSGAAGAVGLLTVQLARLRGATVIGIANSKYHDWLKAHDVIPIDYHGDTVAALHKVSDTIDAFIDASGHGYVEMAVNELGINKDRIDTFIDFAAAGKYGVKAEGGAAATGINVLQDLVSLIVDGKLDVPISKTFALDDVQEAYKYVSDKHDIGKAVFVFD